MPSHVHLQFPPHFLAILRSRDIASSTLCRPISAIRLHSAGGSSTCDVRGRCRRSWRSPKEGIRSRSYDWKVQEEVQACKVSKYLVDFIFVRPHYSVGRLMAFGIESEAHSLLQHTEPIHQPGNFTPTKAVYMHSPLHCNFAFSLSRLVANWVVY